MEPVFYNHEDSYKAVRLNGILAMFTISRIERDSLPEGIYAYDIRESDDGNQLSTIEPSVCVNHGGTILTFQEIPMPSKGYVDIEECNFGPDESLSFEELREEFQKPSLGILPQGASLFKELENAVCKSYDNELCPDCEGPLIYEIDDAPVGKGLSNSIDVRFVITTVLRTRMTSLPAISLYKPTNRSAKMYVISLRSTTTPSRILLSANMRMR